jgi:hypothetical protein
VRLLQSLFFSALCLGLIAQSPSVDYSGIKSSGPIPEDLLRSYDEKYRELINKHGNDPDESDLINEDYWITQNHEIEALLQSGKFSFGDISTEYINAVADKVLSNRPELRGKLRFYLYRSPEANAFCVSDGIIGISSGLLANLNSEAELAFVLAHEASHMALNHSYDSYLDQLERKQLDDNLSSDEIAEYYIERSQKQELESDSLAWIILKESPYILEGAPNALKVLFESYHPFGRDKIEGNPLVIKTNYGLPADKTRFFENEISNNFNYLDEGHSHPNIELRLTKLAFFLSDESELKLGKAFLLGEEKFKEVKAINQVETVYLELMSANYAYALYNAYCLEKQYPNNEFLQRVKVRALYALALAKARQKMYRCSPSPGDVVGPAQDLFYILRHSNREELFTYALRAVEDLLEEKPQDQQLLAYQKNIWRLFSAFSEKNPELAFSAKMPYTSQVLAPYSGLTAYKTFVEKDVKYRDSIRNYMPEFLDESYLSSDDYYGYKLNFDRKISMRNLTILNPSVIVAGQDIDTYDRLNSLDCEKTLLEDLNQILQKSQVKGKSLIFDDLNSGDTETYNLITELKMLEREARFFWNIDFSSAHPGIHLSLNLKSPYLVNIRGTIKHSSSDYFYFGITDLRTGQIIYQVVEDEGKTLTPREFKTAVKFEIENL